MTSFGDTGTKRSTGARKTNPPPQNLVAQNRNLEAELRRRKLIGDRLFRQNRTRHFFGTDRPPTTTNQNQTLDTVQTREFIIPTMNVSGQDKQVQCSVDCASDALPDACGNDIREERLIQRQTRQHKQPWLLFFINRERYLFAAIFVLVCLMNFSTGRFGYRSGTYQQNRGQ